MPLEFQTTDIRGQAILLGTGTSVGVPSIGCGCAVCTSTDPRDKRTRCSVLLGLPLGNLLSGWLVPLFTAPVVLGINGLLLIGMALWFLVIHRKVAAL